MKEALSEIWDSIPKSSSGSGWQSIAISPEAPCPVSAAIRYPECLEAVMLEVGANVIPSTLKLPEARGFNVVLERRSPGPSGKVLIILQRAEGGSRDLFCQVAEDVLRVTEVAADSGIAVREFITRILAWMKFMNDLRDSGLSDEEELGLLGELVVADLLFNELLPEEVVLAWVGSERGLHDFSFGQSAIEVKTALGSQDIVHVSSLDQLDASTLAMLFLFRIQVKPDPEGQTLADWADRVLSRSGDAEKQLRHKLIQAGFSSVNRSQFVRRFSVGSIDAYHVGEQFPRLCRSNVSVAILDSYYRLDLKLAKDYQVAVDASLQAIKGMPNVG